MRLQFAVGLLALVAMAGCRQDMHDQPKFIPLRAAEPTLFPDGSSARQPVAGTVARGDYSADTYFYTGKIGKDYGDKLPFPLTMQVMKRGQERFNIYCSPCHSRVGDGNGMIPQRGYRRPPNYTDDKLLKAPLGHFFDVMTNGFGAMPDYASQVPAEDRWAIAAYIRALQLSQHASMAEVPPDQQDQLKQGTEGGKR